MFGKIISDMMVKPGKSPVFESPEKYNLEYEDVIFKTSDNISLSGWLIHGGNDKVVIQSHFGVQCSRCGFTQEGKGLMKNVLWTSDIHFLDQVKYLVDAGYTKLARSFVKTIQLIQYEIPKTHPQHYIHI